MGQTYLTLRESSWKRFDQRLMEEERLTVMLCMPALMPLLMYEWLFQMFIQVFFCRFVFPHDKGSRSVGEVHWHPPILLAQWHSNGRLHLHTAANYHSTTQPTLTQSPLNSTSTSPPTANHRHPALPTTPSCSFLLAEETAPPRKAPTAALGPLDTAAQGPAAEQRGVSSPAPGVFFFPERSEQNGPQTEKSQVQRSSATWDSMH
ncbi:unnamed protein product [Boreogadus saida]